MPQQYEVTHVVKDETWPGRDGEMRTLEMTLKDVGPAVKVTASTKYASPYNADKWPAAGDTIFGSVEGGKFKFAQRNGSGPQGSANGGGDDFARRPEHPANAARMGYAKALELAPVYYELFRTEDRLPQAEDLDKAKATLVAIADWLAGRINAAGHAVEEEPAEDPAPASKPDGDLPF